MLEILWTFLTFLFFLCLHEITHVVSAICLNLKIKSINFGIRPYPMIMVVLKDFYFNLPQYKWIIFLFSSSFTTLSIFFILYHFDFFNLSFLYYGMVFQLILELNPFFSDYTIFLTKYNKLSKYYFMFSVPWYIHLILWIWFIIFFATPNFFIHNLTFN